MRSQYCSPVPLQQRKASVMQWLVHCVYCKQEVTKEMKEIPMSCLLSADVKAKFCLQILWFLGVCNNMANGRHVSLHKKHLWPTATNLKYINYIWQLYCRLACHGKPGKSWNSKIMFSGPGKVMDNQMKPRKSWNLHCTIRRCESLPKFQNVHIFISDIKVRNMSKMVMEFCILFMEFCWANGAITLLKWNKNYVQSRLISVIKEFFSSNLWRKSFFMRVRPVFLKDCSC